MGTTSPHSAVLTSGHRLIAPSDISILLFATQIKHIPRTPMPNLPLKPEVTFCVRGVITPACGVPRLLSSLVPSCSMGCGGLWSHRRTGDFPSYLRFAIAIEEGRTGHSEATEHSAERRHRGSGLESRHRFDGCCGAAGVALEKSHRRSNQVRLHHSIDGRDRG
jgi:hypothetical protein